MAEPVAVAPGSCHVSTHRQSLPGPRSSTRGPPLSQEALVRSCAWVTSARCSSPVCMRYRWANAVAMERSNLALSIPEPEADVDTNDEGADLGRGGEQPAPGDESVARQPDAHNDGQRKQLPDLQQ